MVIDSIILLYVIALALLIYFGFKWHNSSQTVLRPREAAGVPNAADHVEMDGVLAIMNEMDKAILSNASFALFVQSLVPRLLKVLPCSVIAITELSSEEAEALNTYFFTLAAGDISSSMKLDETTQLDKIKNGEFKHNPRGIFIENLTAHASLKPFLNNGANCVLMLPSYVEANLSAVLYFGFADKAQCSELLKQLCSDFACRVSVVMTSLVSAKKLFGKRHFDLVTSLPNTQYCGELLALEISRANRYHSKIAVIFIQLDGVKKINELAGYAVGDSIIKQIADRLRSTLRDTDSVARFSSHEFAVILPEVSSEIGVGKVAQKLIRKISEPYTHHQHQFHLHCRAGISTFPNDAQTDDALLSKADFAMTLSKLGDFTFHTPQINAATSNQLALESDLHQALEKHELFILYQPQIDLRKQKTVGVEVLVRWQHPTKGIVSPDKFLAIAEETDLIIKIGTYVRNAAFKQFKTWQAQGVSPDRIAINLSSKELMHDTFLDNFETQLQQFGLDPTWVEIEITESLLVDITAHVKSTLERLRTLGVTVAIDDFGTGYSSLSYISQLPFDVLKLDKAFVCEIGKSIDKLEIVSLIIDMAHHLKKMVCAEGVENKEQLVFLQDRGCETVQGYLLSRPVSAADFEAFLKDWNASKVKQLLELT